jgi:hypothetical protein
MGLASKVTESTVTVELLVAPLLVTVPVWLAPAPPKFMLQSRFTGPPVAGGGGFRMGRRSETASPYAGFRFICCIM